METAFFKNLGVKLRGFMGGVFIYAFALHLFFLELPEKFPFRIIYLKMCKIFVK